MGCRDDLLGMKLDVLFPRITDEVEAGVWKGVEDVKDTGTFACGGCGKDAVEEGTSGGESEFDGARRSNVLLVWG
jgi:hypothetical protein